jgi:hypothetical protein
MSIVDFSKVDENKLVAIINDEITIYEGENNYNTTFFSCKNYIFRNMSGLISVSFTYDSQHVVYHWDGTSSLHIISYDNLISYRESYKFTFVSDRHVKKYAISPNKNQIAILFKMRHFYYVTFDDREPIDIEYDRSEPREEVQILHVYDFSAGNSRLIFNKQLEGTIMDFALSEFNTIAISGTFNIDGALYGLNIFDLETGNLILYDSEPQSIKKVSFFPTSEDNINKILLISNGIGNFFEDDEAPPFNNMIIKRLDNLETLVDIIIAEYTPINCVYIKRNGEITVGTERGLFFFSLIGQPLRHTRLLQQYNIKQISYSVSGNIIAFPLYDADDIFEEHVIFKFYDLENNRFIPYENEALPIPRVVESIRSGQDAPIYGEPPEAEIYDPHLDIILATPPPDKDKLSQYEGKKCFDYIMMNEETIGTYLSEDVDNLVLFYKHPKDADFFASCLTFSSLKNYLKNPSNVYYRCIHRKNFNTYHSEPPQYLKLPTQGGNLFVEYYIMKQKYLQRQNMIFLEYSERVETTITSMASFTMHFVSCNHCQKGSYIDVYRIIF